MRAKFNLTREVGIPSLTKHFKAEKEEFSMNIVKKELTSPSHTLLKRGTLTKTWLLSAINICNLTSCV